MATCPKGHESQASDYCDTCGTPLADAAPRPRPAPAPQAATCPACGAGLDTRFCEACGHDSLVPVAAPSTVDSPGPAGTPERTPQREPDATAQPAQEQAVEQAVEQAPVQAPVQARTWTVLVTADREYFDRIRALDGPDAGQVEFPPFYPERRFVLADRQVLVGRRSRSRGVHPEIDLTGPPEDAAVSHLHALLVPADGGGWAVVDLRSTNRTYLNGSAEAIPAETPLPLSDGDHVNVGAWTRLTLRSAPP